MDIHPVIQSETLIVWPCSGRFGEPGDCEGTGSESLRQSMCLNSTGNEKR